MSEATSRILGHSSEAQVKEFYSSTLPQYPPLSGDMASMCKPLNDTLLFEMDQVRFYSSLSQLIAHEIPDNNHY